MLFISDSVKWVEVNNNDTNWCYSILGVLLIFWKPYKKTLTYMGYCKNNYSKREWAFYYTS